MIKVFLTDLDNTLSDFMRMKRAAVDTAIDYMVNIGLKIPRSEMYDEIFKIYRATHIESQSAIEQALLNKTGGVDKNFCCGNCRVSARKRYVNLHIPHVEITLKELLHGLKLV